MGSHRLRPVLVATRVTPRLVSLAAGGREMIRRMSHHGTRPAPQHWGALVLQRLPPDSPCGASSGSRVPARMADARAVGRVHAGVADGVGSIPAHVVVVITEVGTAAEIQQQDEHDE